MEANEMGSLPIGRLLRKMSMPLIFSMLVQVLYGLVDSLYVARLGDNALTAISLCIATVTAQAIAALTGLVLNLRFNRDVKVSSKDFMLQAEIVKEIIKIGVPVALSQCLLAIAALGMNTILLGLSALAPGIYVIYLRLQSFIIIPSSGMGNAGISIIAYNYGAKEKDRIMGTLWTSLRVNAVVAVIGLVVFMVLPRQLLLMFNASEAMMEIGIPALRFVAAAFLFTTTTQILSSFLQAMGQGTASFIVATAQTVFMLLFAWIMARTGSATLVWLAFPLMEVVRFVIAVILIRRTYKGKIANLQTD